MAGWVCQTKKLLVSAISSLADELEQTVQDFNDAVHNLSTSRTNRETKDVKEAPDAMLETLDQADHEFTQLPSPGPHLKDQACQDQVFAGRCHHVATTRQPERIRIPTTLNSRLSQSSPSLSPSRHPESKFMIHSYSKSSTYVYRPFTSKSPRHSSLSKSSPCLIHTSGSVKNSSKPLKNTRSHSLERLHNVHSHSTSAGTGIMLQIRSEITHHETCQRVALQQTVNHRLDQKRPGKVIRAATSQNLHVSGGDSLQSLQLEEEVPERNFTGEDHGINDTETGYSEKRLMKATSPMSVEREQQFRIWSGLGPLTRIISFAFAQVANVVLMLTEDLQNKVEQDAAAGGEILAITYPGHDAQGHACEETEEDSEKKAEGPELFQSTLARSPYSTDSFEIIDSSCFDELVDSMAGDFGSHQNSQTSSQIHESPYPEAQFGGTNLEKPDDFHNNITDMSSSAEFVNFDFSDLISNRHYNKLNPVVLENMSDSSSQELAEDGSMYHSFYVICEKVSDIPLNGTTGCVKDRNDNDGMEVLDEEDDNESVSFTIISSENDEEEFLFF